MKPKKKQKSHATHRSAHRSTGKMKTHQIGNPLRDEDIKDPSELNAFPESGSQRGAREGSGPLNQEGEGNRQNDEAAELEEEAQREEK